MWPFNSKPKKETGTGTGTSVTVGSGNAQMSLEQVLGQNADAMHAVSAAQTADLITPLDKEGTTKWDIIAQRAGFDAYRREIGMHQLIRRLTGLETDLMIQAREGQEAQQKAQELANRPRREKVAAGARKAAAAVVKSPLGLFQSAGRNVKNLGEFEAENKW